MYDWKNNAADDQKLSYSVFAVYLNVFSGEATTQFPSATQMTRGILADAMRLGKTFMTIALILANPSRSAYNHDADMEGWNGSEEGLNNGFPMIKGGTLIVCLVALLGQWKVSFAICHHL